MNIVRRSLTGIPRPAIARLGLGLLGALSGCFNPTPPANVLCAPDGWCPSGQTCDMNRWLCVPEGQIPDAGTWPWIDSGWPWPPPDSYYPWPDAGLGEGIPAALAAPWGPTFIQIEQVLVTYVTPGSDAEPEGFFVQLDPAGPAMFVAQSPSFPGVRLAAGDRVSFVVYQMGGLYENSVAEAVGELVVHSRGNDVSVLVQDVSYVTDLPYNAYPYASELVSANLHLTGSFFEDGYGFVIAPVSTNEYSGDGLLYLRMLPALQQEVGIERDCYFRVDGVPLWRYWSESSFPVYDAAELQDLWCPAPDIVWIQADTNTSVQVELSQPLDPTTVLLDGSQFTIAGLTVTGVALDGRFLTITTSSQTAGQTYALEVDDSVRDRFGSMVNLNDNTTFVGEGPRARLRVNEVKANIVPSCDLLELRAVQGGSLEGVRVTEQGATVHTFGSLLVATNDIVVVHFNSFSAQCNPGRSPSETTSVNQRPRVVFGANFDTAYDIYAAGPGLEIAPHTIAVYDQNGGMVDIVLVTDGSGVAPDAESEREAEDAADAGEWRPQSGSVPPGGFRGATFREHAAPGLESDQVTVVNGWSALAGQDSVQRSGNADSNHKGDWVTAPNTFGLPNAGQSPL
jgi:hypothetical protein